MFNQHRGDRMEAEGGASCLWIRTAWFLVLGSITPAFFSDLLSQEVVT